MSMRQVGNRLKEINVNKDFTSSLEMSDIWLEVSVLILPSEPTGSTSWHSMLPVIGHHYVIQDSFWKFFYPSGTGQIWWLAFYKNIHVMHLQVRWVVGGQSDITFTRSSSIYAKWGGMLFPLLSGWWSVILIKTRMHSSRMHIARSSTVLGEGVSMTETPLDRDIPYSKTIPPCVWVILLWNWC